VTAPGHLTLGEVRAALVGLPDDLTLRLGFDHPHAYRGIYADLAFEPRHSCRVARVRAALDYAEGRTFEGWKGGDFPMDAHSYCWLAYEGACGETLGAVLLDCLRDGHRGHRSAPPWTPWSLQALLGKRVHVDHPGGQFSGSTLLSFEGADLTLGGYGPKPPYVETLHPESYVTEEPR